MDLPIDSMVISHSYVTVYRRVYQILPLKRKNRWYMGLSENSVPLHPMVNDHYPYSMVISLGVYHIFRHTHMDMGDKTIQHTPVLWILGPKIQS